MKWKRLALIIAMAFAVSALTPAERDFAEKARAYLAAAKEKVHQQEQVLAEESRRAQEAESTVREQSGQIGTLGDEIKTAHKNEKELAKYNAYAKPIVEQVNSMWGIGGIIYGFKVLAKHLFILLAVLAGVALVFMVLSFFFPAIGAFIRMAGSWLAAIFRRLTRK